jgi:heme/copper-type cytochrome/quinol oxidase subunit 4
MKNAWLKRMIPHVIAVGIFLIVAAVFCKPAMQGKVLQQSDIAGWQGMAQNAFDYQAKNGHAPLWITSMFGGMPNYTIAMGGPWTPTGFFNNLMQLWLPKPMNFFFLACICFYIFTQVLRIRSWIGIGTSLAFAYASFSVIIVHAGHDTQMMALAYCPAVLAGITLIYQGRFLLGAALTAFFTMLNIGVNHQQISYYLLIVAAFMSISYLVNWIKEGKLGHAAQSVGIALLAGTIGVLVSAVNLFTTYDYAKYSKRGGQLIMPTAGQVSSEKTDKDGKTKGLTKEYAFQWSYGKAETYTLMFPGVMGYGARGSELDGNSHIAKFLEEQGQPSDQALQFAQNFSGALYWGDQPFTDGPVYLGAIICFLFLFGLFYSKSHHRWWILAVSILAIFMSWGKYLPGLNDFLFDYLPLYNKFRVPTMTLVIPQLLFPLMAAIGLHEWMERRQDQGSALQALKATGIATAILFAGAAWMYISSDFKNENSQRTAAFNDLMNSKAADMQVRYGQLNNQYPPKPDNQLYENLVFQTQGNVDIAKGIVSALRKDRQSLLGANMIRAGIFILLTALLLWLGIKQKLEDRWALLGILLLSFIDVISIAKKYLPEDSYVEPDQYETVTFPKSAADEQILRDKEPNFRVFNTASGRDPFQESRTSYYHNSIGGYNPAKIGIYDDLITYQLSNNTNPAVVNMLNTKYIIQTDPQTNAPVALQNPGRLGHAWFVQGIRFVNGPAAEMTALNQFNPRDTAIVDESYKAQLAGGFQFDSTASIVLKTFDNDALQYETNASTPQVAIFSEIYYPGGWHAYIDGKQVDYFKANYVLRGMLVPAGKHQIEFKFEPESFIWGSRISTIFSYLLLLLLAVALGWTIRTQRNKSLI